MKVYLAAAWADRQWASTLAAHWRERGVTITSSWHDGIPRAGSDGQLTPEQRREVAEIARTEIRAADALVLLGSIDCRGALWEAGYAEGAGKLVHVARGLNPLTPMLDGRDVGFYDTATDVFAALCPPACRADAGCEYKVNGDDGLCWQHRATYSRRRERMKLAIDGAARGQYIGGRRPRCLLHPDREPVGTLDEPNGYPEFACAECLGMMAEAEAAE